MTVSKEKRSCLPVDTWKDKRYEDQKKIRPFVQWNASKFENKIMLIQDEYAQMAKWQVTEHSTWELAECIFESSSEVKQVWQSSEPIMVFIGVVEKFWVFHQPYGNYKKGDRKPDNEPVNNDLHRSRQTYLVAFLDYDKDNQCYILLHQKPFRFTPKSTNAGEFENLYNWLRKLVFQLYGEDYPSFLFPLHLGGIRKLSYNADKTVPKRINVPIVLKPKCPNSPNAKEVNKNEPKTPQDAQSLVAQLENEVDKMFLEMGDDIRLQMREWYDEYIASSPATATPPVEKNVLTNYVTEKDDSDYVF